MVGSGSLKLRTLVEVDMASQNAHDLLRVIEDMVQDRSEDIVGRKNLQRQMEARENWDEVQFDEAETELIRSDVVIQTPDGEQLQVHSFEL